MYNTNNLFMEKKHFSLRRKAYALMSLAAGVTLLASCAQDGFDEDERWQSSVKNTTLSSPSADDISITPSADNSQTVISWNIVHGAGGYICSVYDMSDPASPAAVDGIQDSLIDRSSLAVTRTDDTNYKFVIKTAGNESLNNKEAETATEVEFTSFTETYMAIPAGSDLTQWFQQNPVPDNATEESLAYDLEAGAEYTMSGDINFFNKKVSLRTTNKNNHAKITFTSDVSLKTATKLELKYIDFDCTQSAEPFIELSDELDESIKGVISGSQNYYDITQSNSMTINSCKIEGLANNLIYDGKIKYCLGTCVITNSIVRFNITSAKDVSAIIQFNQGFINDLTIQNSTLYNTGDSDAKYFVQYNNSGRCDRGGYLSNSINYKNNTFYNLAKSGQWGNYNGFAGRSSSYWVMTDNIFVDCGNSQVPRRFLGGRTNSANRTFSNNTYMFDGAFESTGGSVSGYDDSGTAIESDPAFANPANGDFTVNGAEQLSKITGDPRWLPEN